MNGDRFTQLGMAQDAARRALKAKHVSAMVAAKRGRPADVVLADFGNPEHAWGRMLACRYLGRPTCQRFRRRQQ